MGMDLTFYFQYNTANIYGKNAVSMSKQNLDADSSAWLGNR